MIKRKRTSIYINNKNYNEYNAILLLYIYIYPRIAAILNWALSLSMYSLNKAKAGSDSLRIPEQTTPIPSNAPAFII